MGRALNAIKGMSDHAKVLLGLTENAATQAATVMGNDARNVARGVRGDASDAFDAAYASLSERFGYRYNSTEDKLRAMSYMRRNSKNFDLQKNAEIMAGIQDGQRVDATLGQRIGAYFSAPDATGRYDKTRIALAAIGGVLGTAAATRVGMNVVEGNY